MMAPAKIALGPSDDGPIVVFISDADRAPP